MSEFDEAYNLFYALEYDIDPSQLNGHMMCEYI